MSPEINKRICWKLQVEFAQYCSLDEKKPFARGEETKMAATKPRAIVHIIGRTLFSDRRNSRIEAGIIVIVLYRTTFSTQEMIKR